MLKICTIVLTFISICFAQQTNTLKQETLTDGDSIVRQARDSAGLSLPITSLRLKLHRSLQIGMDETAAVKIRGNEITLDHQDEMTILFPNKIRKVSVAKNNIL